MTLFSRELVVGRQRERQFLLVPLDRGFAAAEVETGADLLARLVDRVADLLRSTFETMSNELSCAIRFSSFRRRPDRRSAFRPGAGNANSDAGAAGAIEIPRNRIRSGLRTPSL